MEMAATLPDVHVPNELNNLSALMEEKPEMLAAGSEDIRLAALHAAKYVFDMGASEPVLQCTLTTDTAPTYSATI
jgi:hypothetical protein